MTSEPELSQDRSEPELSQDRSSIDHIPVAEYVGISGGKTCDASIAEVHNSVESTEIRAGELAGDLPISMNRFHSG